MLVFAQVEQFSEGMSQWQQSIAEACTIEHPMLRSTDHMALCITKLACNTCYQFRVVATNRIGRSEKGQPTVVVRTLQSVPAPPSDVRITHVSSDQIALSWNLPHIDGGSAIEGVQIEQARPMRSCIDRVCRCSSNRP